MNRDAWFIFAVLAAAAAVGLLGFTAWQKNEELLRTRVDLARAQAAAGEQSAALGETRRELSGLRERAELLAREMASVTNSQLRLQEEMRAAVQSRDVAISELQGRLTVSILDRILFDTGEATVKPEGMKVLDQVAQVLGGFTNRQVQVYGHTDNVPIRLRYASNWELSTARAIAAVRYLSEKAGVDPRRLSAVGCGEFQPIADNATPEGRARNRRIALVVLPEQFAPTDVSVTDTNVPPAAGPGTNMVPVIPPGPAGSASPDAAAAPAPDSSVAPVAPGAPVTPTPVPPLVPVPAMVPIPSPAGSAAQTNAVPKGSPEADEVVGPPKP